MTTSAKLAIQAAVAEASRRGSSRYVGNERRRQAFGRLVHEHAARIHGLAHRLGPPGEAEDLVQETFVRAWRGIHRFRREAELTTWMYRILVNVSRDRYRRRARKAGALEARQPPVDPGAQASRRETLDRVLEAVDQLPPRQREALTLRARGGLAYAEIARVMGVRVGSVKSHLVAARRALVARFDGELGSLGGSA